MPWLLFTLCLALAAALLIVAWLQEGQRANRVLHRLHSGVDDEGDQAFWNGLLIRIGSSDWGLRMLAKDSETLVLLNRVGWRRARRRAMFLVSQFLLPLLLIFVTVLFQAFSTPSKYAWIWPFLAAGTGYLLPKRLLVMAATRRQRQLTVEITTFIPLLRVLFESGLTVEQAIRVLSQEARQILPQLSWELRIVLARVDSGAELADQLSQLGNLLAVDEVTDCLAILQQLIRQGGGAMNSLLALKRVLDQRRLTRLQEYISRLSAKMAVVMMLFLFPALLIVLAGPGFNAIGHALRGMAG
ncbi:type II secretion system F family protein [Pseudomonas sp. LRF_L74]|uniref:type II secretion system F family protein n=1 Tax=Pseudomonas sp. LRF_L74 TaxID=3369422 RepID=UPI003F604C60